jgi:carbamoyltransferase
LKILGISSFYHDSAAAIVEDGKIIAAAQEERFTRKKHDDSFPKNAVKFCLQYAGTNLNDLDAIVFYDKPLLKFERLLETYYAFSPKGLRSFLTAIPVWLNDKMFLKRLINKELKEIDELYDKSKVKLLFPEHHLSHAASTYYPSGFEEAAILTVDGVGEWATASICHGIGKDIKVLKELRFPHSLGLLYSAFTYYLGFKVNSGEYKLMGLAPYGDPSSPDIKKYVETIKKELIDIKDDGSIWLNQKYFDYATGLTMAVDNKWKDLFGFERRLAESELEQKHCNLGLAIQQITEEVVIKMAEEAKRLTGSSNICLAGGVALNCVANGKLIKSNVFDNVFIQPAAGDAGGALGAALAAYHIYFEKERIVVKPDAMMGSYLGPEYSDIEVKLMAKKYGASYTYFEHFNDLAVQTAKLIADGKAVGWFQGRMEFGPRALGGRSILGDARNEEMQKKLNLKIKFRESFRPFAPSVLAEDCELFFEHKATSPYMLVVQPLVNSRRLGLPANFESLSIKDKLYYKRSDVPAITHIDFSGRIQTVHKQTNPRYWELINEFKKVTGYGIVVNTSFNVRGEPIVCSPEDAYKCLMRTEMDHLVVGDFIFNKIDQPVWKEQSNWKEEFVLD